MDIHVSFSDFCHICVLTNPINTIEIDFFKFFLRKCFATINENPPLPKNRK